jgi:hypothetical protein
MQYRFSKHSAILSETRKRRTRVTPLRYLAATDASGGVARQQKIKYAHESLFYHYAQFPHPFAITYRGKKYSRILFGQPSHALQAITADMLHRVWDEFDYRVDVCRVTQSAHIEGL